MFLTNDEVQDLRATVEAYAGFDQELAQRCSHLIHIGAYDEAVRNAFVLLEERLRKAVGQERMTGTELANFAFSPTSGPLAKQLAHSVSEREGLRELYSGAFKLFRNPSAHGVVGYDRVEGKSIVGFVNLLLKILAKVDELPNPNLIPQNVEQILNDFDKVAGTGPTSRLRAFVGKCIKAGLEPNEAGKQWIPFKLSALMQLENWGRPRPHQMAVFYLLNTSGEQGLWVPINQYYKFVIGFDIASLQRQLRALGFQPTGKGQEYYINLKAHSDRAFFDELLDLVLQTEQQLDKTLG